MMIKRYSDWEVVNEVEELTEVKLTGKYFNSIVKTYTDHPEARPSRDVTKFPNAKNTQQLGAFVKTLSGKTSSEIIEAVINNWYKWPNDSQAKSVLLSYIKNDDDLSNLAAFGVPFGKAILQDPSLISLGSIGKSAVKSLGKAKLFRWVPKMFGIAESQRVNEAAPVLAAIGGFLLRFAGAALLSSSIKYTLYGKETLEDDLFFSWTTPYLPDIKGVVGDDPIIATYVSTFNSVMMITYDAWNLCMGQEKYGMETNPVSSWEGKENYINYYYKEFYESDEDISRTFKVFMSDLKNACMQDMRKPEIFESCPFYYNGDKIRLKYEDGKTELITVENWFNWIKDNYKTYIIFPVPESETQFNLRKREGEFAPLSPVGITDTVKGDPMREVTIQFPDGKVGKLSVLQLELFFMSEKNASAYSVESQDVTEGGSSLILKMKEGQEATGQESNKPPTDEIATVDPSIIRGSSLQEIALNLKNEVLTSFAGMGDI